MFKMTSAVNFTRHAMLKVFPIVQSLNVQYINIGIKHGFSCINIRQVSWEVLKTEAFMH